MGGTASWYNIGTGFGKTKEIVGVEPIDPSIKASVNFGSIPVSYKIEANNPSLLPKSENVASTGDALDVYVLPTFETENRLLQSLGMSSVRTELLGRLQFKPAYSEDGSTTDFGELYELRHQLLALAHENIEQAESDTESVFKSEYESLLQNYRDVYSSASTKLNDIVAAARIIDNTALSNSARITSSTTMPSYLENLVTTDTSIPQFETVYLSTGDAAGCVLEIFDISSDCAELFTETKMIGQLWSELKTSVLYWTTDFNSHGSPVGLKASSFEDGAEGALAKTHMSYKFQSWTVLNGDGDPMDTGMNVRQLGTDNIGGELTEDTFEALFWDKGVAQNWHHQLGYIKWLTLAISRELSFSALSGITASDFGTSDHTVLDFAIGKFAESEDGAASIFDLGSQPGGSIGDYLHATGSLDDGTTVNVLPFETRRLKYDGASYYGSYDMVSQILSDSTFDTTGYSEWVDEYTGRAKKTCEYISGMLGLGLYSSDGVLPDYRAGLTWAESMEGGPTAFPLTYFKEDALNPISPAMVFKSAFEIAKKMCDSIRHSDGTNFIALPFIARLSPDLLHAVSKVISLTMWNSAIKSDVADSAGAEYSVRSTDLQDALTNFTSLVGSYIKDNYTYEDEGYKQIIICDDDDDYSDASSKYLNLFKHESKESGFTTVTESRERVSLSASQISEAMERIGYTDAFHQLFMLAWQAHVDAGGAASSPAEAVFDASTLISAGSTYNVNYTASAGDYSLWKEVLTGEADVEGTSEGAEELSAQVTVDYSNTASLLHYSFSGARTSFRYVSIDYLASMLWELVSQLVLVNSDFTIGLERSEGGTTYIYSSHQNIDSEATFAYDMGKDPSLLDNVLGSMPGTGEGVVDDPVIQLSCFVAGTQIAMGDGSCKSIEDVKVGDMVMTSRGAYPVIGLDWTVLGSRKLYAFNESKKYFVTSEHPFMTTVGWKSISPDATRLESENLHGLLQGALSAGDSLVMLGGDTQDITSIESMSYTDIEMPLYNFIVDEAHEYYADGFLVHNKVIGTSLGPRDDLKGFDFLEMIDTDILTQITDDMDEAGGGGGYEWPPMDGIP